MREFDIFWCDGFDLFREVFDDLLLFDEFAIDLFSHGGEGKFKVIFDDFKFLFDFFKVLMRINLMMIRSRAISVWECVL